MFTQEDKNNTLADIIKFEVLEQEYAAKGQDKQSVHCGNKQKELFLSLSVMCGGDNTAIEELNEFSEKNYSRIEKEVLGL